MFGRQLFLLIPLYVKAVHASQMEIYSSYELAYIFALIYATFWSKWLVNVGSPAKPRPYF